MDADPPACELPPPPSGEELPDAALDGAPIGAEAVPSVGCECIACGRTFASLPDFDRHTAGAHPQICRDPSEIGLVAVERQGEVAWTAEAVEGVEDAASPAGADENPVLRVPEADGPHLGPARRFSDVYWIRATRAQGRHYDASRSGPDVRGTPAQGRYYDASRSGPDVRGTPAQGRYYDASRSGPDVRDTPAQGRYYDASRSGPDIRDTPAQGRYYDASRSGPDVRGKVGVVTAPPPGRVLEREPWPAHHQPRDGHEDHPDSHASAVVPPDRAPAVGDAPAVPAIRAPTGTAAGRTWTAADFLEESLVPPDTTATGWRGALARVGFGIVSRTPKPRDRHARDLLERIHTPLSGTRRIVVVSRKGGVGKTTTTLMLGHTFAAYRGDRIVALDANPDAGNLAYRLSGSTWVGVSGLLAHGQDIERYADVRAYTAQSRGSHLEVVASDDDPGRTLALGEHDYRRAVALLERYYNLILLDTGTGILHSATQGMLKEAEQLIVVMQPTVDSARAAASTLDWLDEHGYADLVRRAVAVINGVRGRQRVDRDVLERHFSHRCGATVAVPWDEHLEPGGVASLEGLRPRTRMAYLELAVAVVEGLQGHLAVDGGSPGLG